jgi:replicative DNA helicase Mcm
LSETIDREDVKRAIDLVEASMSQVGYVLESGQFDADIVETGASKSQRDRRGELPCGPATAG